MSVKTVSSQADAANPLGYEKEGKLLVGFAIPCIISMLVTALYNIVDQIFIGQGVGLLGNAATNIAFPLSIACTAIALLLGIGSATNFSLQLGAGNEKRSAEYAGNGLCLMALFGTVLMAVTLLFLTPMLKFFGATPDVLPYAEAYTRITALGFPFLIMNTGMSKLILAALDHLRRDRGRYRMVAHLQHRPHDSGRAGAEIQPERRVYGDVPRCHPAGCDPCGRGALLQKAVALLQR